MIKTQKAGSSDHRRTEVGPYKTHNVRLQRTISNRQQQGINNQTVKQVLNSLANSTQTNFNRRTAKSNAGFTNLIVAISTRVLYIVAACAAERDATC